MNRLLEFVLVLSVVLSQSQPLPAADDWRVWRGPNGNGVAAEGQSVPTEWSDSKNVVWKTPVAGRGHSSPIVFDDKIVLTTADEKAKTQSVLCFDRQTGKPLWQTQVNQGGLPPAGEIHRNNTHATPTVAYDGERILAVFHHHGGVHLTALSPAGKQLWTKEVGGYVPRSYKYGYAPSPLIYGATVIVASEYEEPGYVAAFERQSGREVWRIGRSRQVSYSSPIVAKVAGREQMLLSGADQVTSYDPKNGKQLWSVPGTSLATCGTMIWTENMVFASGGYPKSETIAVRADGSGKVAWRNREKCYEQSMLVHAGHIFAVTDGGIAFCWDAETGAEIWKNRLNGKCSASPILAGGNIYITNERGTTNVFRADPTKFESVAKNQLGDETFATMSICGNQIFLRTASSSAGGRQEMLYCLGLGK